MPGTRKNTCRQARPVKKEPLSVGKKAQERDDKEKICAFYMGDKGRKRQREAKKVAFLEEKCTERAKTGGFRGLGLGSKGKNVQKLGFLGLRLRVDGGGLRLRAESNNKKILADLL